MNKSMHNKITSAAALYQTPLLQELYSQLLNERDIMNKFFDLFLGKVNLTKLPKTSPSWITYDKKFAEYSEVETNIKTAEYYLRGRNAI